MWWDRWFIRELRVSHWSEFSTRFKNRPQKVRQWQLPVCATRRSWAVQRRLIIRRQEIFKAFYWILTTYLCLLMSSYNLPVRQDDYGSNLSWLKRFVFSYFYLYSHTNTSRYVTSNLLSYSFQKSLCQWSVQWRCWNIGDSSCRPEAAAADFGRGTCQNRQVVILLSGNGKKYKNNNH